MRASDQIFRCYPVPDEPKKKKKSSGLVAEFQASTGIAAEIGRVGGPWAGPMLIFDCETLTGAKDGQGLRFGCFQERGWRYDWRVADAAAGKLTREKLDTRWHEGLFYAPENCKPEEICTLESYAETREMELYTREDFIKKILFRNHWVKYAKNWEDALREPCLVIGHNLPFDLGALAIHCGLATKDLYGGLSLVLQREKSERRAAIKKIGFGKHLFRGTKLQNGTVLTSNSDTKPRYMELTEYLDTMAVARALLGPGPSSMKDLLRRLNVPKEFQKETVDLADFSRPPRPL